MPIVSIVVPVYNVEAYLRRCIDSILAQTFTENELILVDDGSTDNCGEICDEYAEKHSHIRVIHQDNKGVAVARNVGLDWVFEHSDSQWIAFVDSDDWVHPKYLEYMLQAASMTNAEISMCGFMEVKQDTDYANEELRISVVSPAEAYTYKTTGVYAYPWGRLCKKEKYTGIRYPENRTWEDLAITYRVLYSTDRIAVVENVLYYYFIHNNSIVHKPWHKGKLDELTAYEDQIPFFDQNGEKWISDRLLKSYIYGISNQYELVCKSEYPDQERKTISRVLQGKMRKALKHYGKRLKASLVTTPWFYEVAYPTRMRFYWLLRALISKLKKKA